MGNTKPGKSGMFGVFWHERAGKWGCQIRNKDKVVYLGLFKTKTMAAKAYNVEAKRLGKQRLNRV